MDRREINPAGVEGPRSGGSSHGRYFHPVDLDYKSNIVLNAGIRRDSPQPTSVPIPEVVKRGKIETSRRTSRMHCITHISE